MFAGVYFVDGFVCLCFDGFFAWGGRYVIVMFGFGDIVLVLILLDSLLFCLFAV